MTKIWEFWNNSFKDFLGQSAFAGYILIFFSLTKADLAYPKKMGSSLWSFVSKHAIKVLLTGSWVLTLSILCRGAIGILFDEF